MLETFKTIWATEIVEVERPNYPLIGYRLKMVRKNNGMTQQQMAKAMGVHRSYISRLESGKITWTVNKVKQYLRLAQEHMSDNDIPM